FGEGGRGDRGWGGEWIPAVGPSDRTGREPPHLRSTDSASGRVAPRGSDDILVIASPRGPKPNRWSASAAARGPLKDPLGAMGIPDRVLAPKLPSQYGGKAEQVLTGALSCG